MRQVESAAECFGMTHILVWQFLKPHVVGAWRATTGLMLAIPVVPITVWQYIAAGTAFSDNGKSSLTAVIRAGVPVSEMER